MRTPLSLLLATAVAAVFAAVTLGEDPPRREGSSTSQPVLLYAAAKGPVGKGLLGQTQEFIVKRMGGTGYAPKDRWERFDAPHSQITLYDKLGNADLRMVFAYDANGRCTYVKAGRRHSQRELYKPAMDFVLGENASVDNEVAKVFPQFLTQDSRTRWSYYDTGTSWIESRTDHNAQVGVARIVMVTPGKKAYAFFDMLYDSDAGNTPVVHSPLKMMDAELFWDVILHDLTIQAKGGMPSNSSRHIYNKNYEEALTSVVGNERSDQNYMVARRLTAAVTCIVKNPDLPMSMLTDTVAMLWRMDGGDLTKEMTLLIRGSASPQALRAVEVMGMDRDPEGVDELLAAWAKSPKAPQFVTALQQITGQDLGPDPAAWKTWWTANKAGVMKDHEESMKVIFNDVDVYVVSGSKGYHRHSCPNLKAQPMCLKLQEARKDYQPCSECKPAK